VLGQSLVMTPQLQQAIKLLALSNLEVESFIGDALDGNPLLEVAAATAEEPPPAAMPAGEARTTVLERSPVDRLIAEGRAADDRPLDVDPAARDDAGYRGASDAGWSGEFGGDMGGGERPSIDERGAAAPTLAEHLDAQLGLACDDPRTLAIARHLIGLLDEAGYLSSPLDEVAEALALPFAEVAGALTLVQSLEPAGVGACTLAECIAIQAREADRYDPAMATLIASLDLVARGDFARLKRLCAVDDEDLSDMLAELRGYDPKPGLRFGAAEASPVVPDVLIVPRADGWDIAINPATLPRVIVNRTYYTELRVACDDKTARGWLTERLADANWLVKALDQRQRTILKVASEIVRQQDGFFRRGVAHLKPLTLRTVADAIGMHESTVSRVTSNKYLNCARGTFELKFFFASGVAATEGEGGASAEAVKAAIRRLIEGESAGAVLSDDALVDQLRDRGFDLARRTVAKYREAIGLGSSVQRRRQKALAGMR
jgi:RNA polymerase sigma-54 factor